jgi:hypothetical protein
MDETHKKDEHIKQQNCNEISANRLVTVKKSQ